jgi:AraC family transcriptional regulator, regulatory protein of adaptative response / methylated-DNA-[protein]-cysteine methyltransferase
MDMTNPQKYWMAVLERDRKFDGRFVYAVRSTGIYCRPTCPSRRPDRTQVVFFTASEKAEQAGFRPCRRCEPATETASRSELLRQVCRHLEANSSESVSVSALSRKFSISSSHLQRLFKRALGVSVAQYAKACRMKSFKAAVRNGSDVTAAMYEAGFGSSSRLYETSDASLGMTPAVYRKGGGTVQIRYTTARSSLGRLLVAATDRGVCAVTLGDNDRELVSALRNEYPGAQIARDRLHLFEAVDRLLKHLNGAAPCPEFPLDIRATAFQRRVWEELRRIPYGATRTYSEIAATMGMPAASRAVARACATNPVALVIPCHRVIGKSGKPGGYRWGKKRKERLLEVEKAGRHVR